MKRVLITGINSDIGFALTEVMLGKEYEIYGTYNEINDNVINLLKLNVKLYQVDFSKSEDINSWLQKIKFSQLELIFFMHGTLEPIGKLGDIEFSQWLRSNNINYLSIVSVLNFCLNKLNPSCRLITIAGGGVNNAPTHFSAYTSAKISLVKLTELCAAEYPQLLFFNLGPGWVDTRIHKQTLSAKEMAGNAYQATLERYESGKFVDMVDVINALLFLAERATLEYSGRNFSVASGELSDNSLKFKLASDDNLFKLRRFSDKN